MKLLLLLLLLFSPGIFYIFFGLVHIMAFSGYYPYTDI